MKTKIVETKSRLPVLGFLLLATGLAGCASTDTARLVARTEATPFYTITVKFDDDNCPVSVTPPTQDDCDNTGGRICVERGKSVQWVSNPVGTAFQVYFDPFVGRPYVSRPPDETTKAVVVINTAMKGNYEYSVLGLVCTGEKPVLDPAFRVID